MQLIAGLVTLLVLLAGFLFFAFCWSLIGAIPMWLLWNWIMPTVFGLHAITLLQAWGIVFLCSILFKSSAKSNS